jgi:hypothetical protein
MVVALCAVNIWLRFSDPAKPGNCHRAVRVRLSMLAVVSWLGDEPVGLRTEK